MLQITQNESFENHRNSYFPAKRARAVPRASIQPRLEHEQLSDGIPGLKRRKIPTSTQRPTRSTNIAVVYPRLLLHYGVVPTEGDFVWVSKIKTTSGAGTARISRVCGIRQLNDLLADSPLDPADPEVLRRVAAVRAAAARAAAEQVAADEDILSLLLATRHISGAESVGGDFLQCQATSAARAAEALSAANEAEGALATGAPMSLNPRFDWAAAAPLAEWEFDGVFHSSEAALGEMSSLYNHTAQTEAVCNIAVQGPVQLRNSMHEKDAQFVDDAGQVGDHVFICVVASDASGTWTFQLKPCSGRQLHELHSKHPPRDLQVLPSARPGGKQALFTQQDLLATVAAWRVGRIIDNGQSARGKRMTLSVAAELMTRNAFTDLLGGGYGEEAEGGSVDGEGVEGGMGGAEKAAAEKATAEKAEAEKVAAEKAEAEKVAAEKAAAEKAAAEKVAAEKAEAEKAEAEKAEAEKATAEKAEAEKEAAEKAEAEKAEGGSDYEDPEGGAAAFTSIEVIIAILAMAARNASEIENAALEAQLRANQLSERKTETFNEKRARAVNRKRAPDPANVQSEYLRLTYNGCFRPWVAAPRPRIDSDEVVAFQLALVMRSVYELRLLEPQPRKSLSGNTVKEPFEWSWAGSDVFRRRVPISLGNVLMANKSLALRSLQAKPAAYQNMHLEALQNMIEMGFFSAFDGGIPGDYEGFCAGFFPSRLADYGVTHSLCKKLKSANVDHSVERGVLRFQIPHWTFLEGDTMFIDGIIDTDEIYRLTADLEPAKRERVISQSLNMLFGTPFTQPWTITIDRGVSRTLVDFPLWDTATAAMEDAVKEVTLDSASTGFAYSVIAILRLYVLGGVLLCSFMTASTVDAMRSFVFKSGAPALRGALVEPGVGLEEAARMLEPAVAEQLELAYPSRSSAPIALLGALQDGGAAAKLPPAEDLPLVVIDAATGRKPTGQNPRCPTRILNEQSTIVDTNPETNSIRKAVQMAISGLYRYARGEPANEDDEDEGEDLDKL